MARVLGTYSYDCDISSNLQKKKSLLLDYDSTILAGRHGGRNGRPYYVHNWGAENKPEVESGYTNSKPSPSEPLPSARLHLLNVPQLSQIVQPAGDQAFKYMNLWVHLTFKYRL